MVQKPPCQHISTMTNNYTCQQLLWIRKGRRLAVQTQGTFTTRPRFENSFQLHMPPKAILEITPENFNIPKIIVNKAIPCINKEFLRKVAS